MKIKRHFEEQRDSPLEKLVVEAKRQVTLLKRRVLTVTRTVHLSCLEIPLKLTGGFHFLTFPMRPHPGAHSALHASRGKNRVQRRYLNEQTRRLTASRNGR
jgi:hypothetical protein